ncbi:ZINC/IRON TRANSPORTER, putative [Babesia bigemina]|uniref:ZINC/IRON TRANSPORTER, putative n=1 Tax=Babesia bigemina TaxID=5866 RepID=A0A061D6K6_BABBI|nr:ZINC/IRON TRANSPORTER, putative [Babesia bigemina]CDR96296.1 ZINC/IRON TRANSPORTER, putative [Babesia bigemina]|eukprot:XP_012768482.1 ZINC/IRON TRANSPORTER, putative [Babesia bigemina]
MNVGVAKFLSAVLIGFSGLLGCLIPYLVVYFSKGNTDLKERQDAIDSRLCLCNCLGAGIIMGMAFLHILPEAVAQCEEGSILWKLGHGQFNPGYFIALMAFCGMLFIERVLSSGRTPCSAAFNACQVPSGCCGFEEESASCCESASRSAACDMERAQMEHHDDYIEDDAPRTVASIGSRFRHRHNRLLSKIMRVLCPLCQCNGLCITLALFIHSLFEGIVVGLAESHWNLWLMTVGIILHKWAAGMALSSFVSSNSKLSAIVMQTIFCMSSPLGILIGGIASGRSEFRFAIVNHELFCHMHCRKTAFWKWLCVFAGMMFIFGTALLEVAFSGGCAHSHVHDGCTEHAGHAHCH